MDRVKPNGKYDDPNIAEGSGGGMYKNLKKGGQGGGIIWIQSNNMTLNGSLLANGNDAVTQYGGGGSGGSIYIAKNTLQGICQIQVNGGKGLNGGGGGSGGRIKIFHFSWYNASSYPGISLSSLVNFTYDPGNGTNDDNLA